MHSFLEINIYFGTKHNVRVYFQVSTKIIADFRLGSIFADLYAEFRNED